MEGKIIQFHLIHQAYTEYKHILSTNYFSSVMHRWEEMNIKIMDLILVEILRNELEESRK